MLNPDFIAGFRAAMDVVLEYFSGTQTQQEFMDKYGLTPKWGDSIMEQISNHALAVAEIYIERGGK